MAEQDCGASIQAVAIRVATLEQDGVPLPGAGRIYTTDTLTELVATPVYTKGTEIEALNAGGGLCVNYKDRDRLKRYDLALTLCSLDPELENMLAGGLTFSSAGYSVGGAVPAVGSVGAPYGTSVELWSKHIIDGDLDTIWPYIQWGIGRAYWQPGQVRWANAEMPRPFTGYTTENANFYNGPGNDWSFDTTRSIFWKFTRTLPAVTCGATALAAS